MTAITLATPVTIALMAVGTGIDEKLRIGTGSER